MKIKAKFKNNEIVKLKSGFRKFFKLNGNSGIYKNSLNIFSNLNTNLLKIISVKKFIVHVLDDSHFISGLCNFVVIENIRNDRDIFLIHTNILRKIV